MPMREICLSGLLDLQVNGAVGDWFSSPHIAAERIEGILQYYCSCGVTKCLPTLITADDDVFVHGLRTLRAAIESDSPLSSRMIVGVHLEGPWISDADGPRGAHPRSSVRSASISDFDRWQDLSGNRVRLVTLAPECPGALAVIPQLVERNIVVAIGHTGAGGDLIREAVDRGATLSTHLGNGCSASMDRHNNVFWPQLADRRLATSVIADGAHIPPDLLRTILLCKDASQVILTSDISGFAGLGPGVHRHGEMAVESLPDGRIVVAGQPQYLAGSGVMTAQCVAHWHDVTGMSIEDSWELASSNPRKLLGLPLAETSDESDSVRVRVDRDHSRAGEPKTTLTILETSIGGEVVFSNSSE